VFVYLLDTNTFGYIASGSSPLARAEYLRLENDGISEICISVITEAEIRYGLAWGAISAQRSVAIESLLLKVEILPWDSEAAAAYGRARAALRKKGLTVENMDMLIAAHAASTGATLVTHDSIFSRIAELANISAIVDWAKDITAS
jgi:tRNA(fMet)-specific endonuclease VapC